MTVEELITELQKLPKDLPVYCSVAYEGGYNPVDCIETTTKAEGWHYTNYDSVKLIPPFVTIA